MKQKSDEIFDRFWLSIKNDYPDKVVKNNKGIDNIENNYWSLDILT